MANRDAAERACKDPNPIIDGRKANVNLAYLGAKPRGIPKHCYIYILLTAYKSIYRSKRRNHVSFLCQSHVT